MKSTYLTKVRATVITEPKEMHDSSTEKYYEKVEKEAITSAKELGIVPTGTKAWVTSDYRGNLLVYEMNGQLLTAGKIVLKEQIIHKTPHTWTLDTEIYLLS